jgi:hypothetical protein
VAPATFTSRFRMHSFDFLFPSYKLRSWWPPRLHESIHVLLKLHSSQYSKRLTGIKIGYFVSLPHYHALRTKLTFMFTSKVSCFQNNYLHFFNVNRANIGWSPVRWTSSVPSYTASSFTASLVGIPAYTQGPTQYTHEYE